MARERAGVKGIRTSLMRIRLKSTRLRAKSSHECSYTFVFMSMHTLVRVQAYVRFYMHSTCVRTQYLSTALVHMPVRPLTQDIVEVNNVPVSGGVPPLKEGDAVKVRQIVKGGREKIWSGVIASFSAPASPGGNTVKPDAPRAPRKRKQNATKQTPTKRARKPGKLYNL